MNDKRDVLLPVFIIIVLWIMVFSYVFYTGDQRDIERNKCISSNISDKPTIFEEDVIRMYCDKCGNEISVSKDQFYVRCKD
jgi:uncharacterized protein YneF (UPF0154 family)